MKKMFRKQTSLTCKDNLEERFYMLNDYGYNFYNQESSHVNDDNLFLKPKNIVNKEFIASKR